MTTGRVWFVTTRPRASELPTRSSGCATRAGNNLPAHQGCPGGCQSPRNGVGQSPSSCGSCGGTYGSTGSRRCVCSQCAAHHRADQGKWCAITARRGPCADGSRYQDGPRRHLDARAGVRHSPPLIGDDFKACPWSTGICVPVECGRGGGWCFRRLCADAIHVECERARVCEPHLCSGGYNPAFEKHAYEPRHRKARVRKRGPRKWGPRFWDQEGSAPTAI